MKISVDAQPLLNPTKSGVGYYGHSLVKELSKFPETQQTLEFFAFRHAKEKLAEAEKYCGDNVFSDSCRWFTMRVYLLLTAFIPLPRRLFFKNRADVNFYFNYTVPPGVRGKKVVVVHDMVIRDCPETASRRTKTVLRLFLKRSMKRADRIVTVSEFSKQRIIYHYGVSPDKISIVPCGVDTEIYRPFNGTAVLDGIKKKYGINGSYILYLGTLEPRKNILALVKAYRAFSQDRETPPKLVIAGGKGWLFDEIFDYVKSSGMENDVIFTGYVAEEEKVPLLSGAEVFCFPSLYEGFGMPILEAMACGTPVLTSNAASMPEVGGDACEYCDPLSVDSIREGLERLLSDKERRERLSADGMERAKQFTWKESAQKLMSIFREIV